MVGQSSCPRCRLEEANRGGVSWRGLPFMGRKGNLFLPRGIFVSNPVPPSVENPSPPGARGQATQFLAPKIPRAGSVCIGIPFPRHADSPSLFLPPPGPPTPQLAPQATSLALTNEHERIPGNAAHATLPHDKAAPRGLVALTHRFDSL